MLIRALLRLGAVLLPVISSTTCNSFSSTESRAAAVRGADSAWAKAATGKDLDEFMSFYADDATMWPQSGMATQGKESLRAYWQSLFAMSDYSITWAPKKVIVAKSGDLAYTLGDCQTKFRNSNGQLVAGNGTYLVIWRRLADGQWHVVEDMWNQAQSPTEVETSFAEVNGARLYYEIAGQGEPIVLIQGNFGDCRYYDSQFELFARKYRVLRYDLRGFGKSGLPSVGEPYKHHEDLKALMEYLDIPKAHVAGFSAGSGIAIDFVLANPEMCYSVISIGPWVQGFSSPATEELWKEFLTIGEAAKQGGQPAAFQQLLKSRWWRPEMVPPHIMDRLREICAGYSFWHFLNPDPQVQENPPAVKQLDRIKVPVLIVTAQYDVDACREIADLLHEQIPDSRKVDFAGATHMMLMEKPEEFNAAVLDFLNGI